MSLQLKDFAAGVLALSLLGALHVMGTEKKPIPSTEGHDDAPRSSPAKDAPIPARQEADAASTDAASPFISSH